MEGNRPDSGKGVGGKRAAGPPESGEFGVAGYCGWDELGSHHMFIAQVVAVDVDEKYMDEKDQFHLSAAKPLAYSHGRYYGLGECLGFFGYSVQKKGRRE